MMRHNPDPTPDEIRARKVAYRDTRRSHTRNLRRLALASLALLTIGVVIAGLAEPDSGLSTFGGFLVLLTPVLLIAVGSTYLVLRRSGRVDEVEQDLRPEAIDRFPKDRLVSPYTATMWVVAGIMGVGTAGSLPWIVVGDQVDRGTMSWTPPVLTFCSILSLVIAALVVLSVRRVDREAFSEIPGGLRISKFIADRTVRWEEVAAIGVRQQAVSSRYATRNVAELFIRTPAGDLTNSGTTLATATRHERERARHNIRVAASWAQAHDLVGDHGLEVALEYAQGRITAAEMVDGADPRKP